MLEEMHVKLSLRALRTKLSRMLVGKDLRFNSKNGWRLRVIFKNVKTTVNDTTGLCS